MAKFTREKVIQVVLDGRKYVGADLQGIDLSKADLSGAKYTAKTKWPKNFDPEAAGAVL